MQIPVLSDPKVDNLFNCKNTIESTNYECQQTRELEGNIDTWLDMNTLYFI